MFSRRMWALLFRATANYERAIYFERRAECCVLFEIELVQFRPLEFHHVRCSSSLHDLCRKALEIQLFVWITIVCDAF